MPVRAYLGRIAAVTALALGGIGLQASETAAKPLITGLAGIGTYDPGSIRQVGDSGARFIHIAIPWRAVAPSRQPAVWQPTDPADPHYEWSNVDAAVVNAIQGGLAPILLIDGAPPWAQRCGVLPPPPGQQSTTGATAGHLCDPEPSAFGAFARAAATRFSGYFGGLPRVRFWQGFNEPNLSLFFNPQFDARGKPVSAKLYRTLLNVFYKAVKSANGSNLVLAAGLGPIAVPRYTVGPMRFTREMLCMKGRRNPKPTRDSCSGGVHFDIFDIHPYTTGGPNHNGKVDDVQLGDLGKLQKLIRAADRAGRIKGRFRRTPLWATEFSWDSRPPDPGGLPMRILTRWTAEALHRAWRAGITHFFWFSLRDSAPTARHPFSETLESGLYFRGETPAEDRPKRSMYAFRFPFVAYSRPSGFYFWGRTPNSRGGRLLIQIRQGGGWRNAEVVRADRHGIFEGVVMGDYGRKKRGAVRAVYRQERSVPFSLKPVRDFWQPPFGKPVAED